MSGMQLDLIGQAYKISFKKTKLSTGIVMHFNCSYDTYCILQENMWPCQRNKNRTGDVGNNTKTNCLDIGYSCYFYL